MEWHNNIEHDPYERYREAPHGCRDIFAAMLIWLALVLFCVFCCAGCKTQPIQTNTRDSVRTEYKHDSIHIYERDSIFCDRWRDGDTVYITTEKWHTKYRDQLKEVHDTLRLKEKEIQQVKYIPTYYKNVSTGFWILLALLIVIVGWKIAKRILKAKGKLLL